MKKITVAELKQKTTSSQPPLIIDVRPESYFLAGSIEGASNICVHEIVFASKVAEAAPDSSSELVLVGANNESQDASKGYALLADQYPKLSVLEGGIAAWNPELPIHKRQDSTLNPSLNGRFELDTEASSLFWTGRNALNFHNGQLLFKEGRVDIRDGLITDGRIVVDMDSMSCQDIADSKMNQMLIAHLKSSDFFLVDEHPLATLRIHSSAGIKGASYGRPNLSVTASAELRGLESPLKFETQLASIDGQSASAQGVLSLDRTLFGSDYGSGRFFSALAGHVVSDLIELSYKLQLIAKD